MNKVVRRYGMGLMLFAGLVGLPAHAQFTTEREPLGPSSRKTGLVISEIMYNPRDVGTATNALQFIELFNSQAWDENIGGFSIDGSVHYTLPANTVLRAGAFLVVARNPGLIRTNYGITNVFGPWDGAIALSEEEGVVRLRNRQGAVLLDINYEDSPPWPEAADGTGHSLALARPSFGEDNPRAWSESDSVGGSPGRADPASPEPLAALVINEWMHHSDPEDWIELYNHSNVPLNISGAWLSDDPLTNKFRIPNGTIIPARGFLSWDQTAMGFELFAGGETIFLWNSNATRVLDVIDFRGSSNNLTWGRYPDGGPFTYALVTNTRNAANSTPYRFAAVINEIMYNPISGNSDDEYVEIHNRSSAPLDLSGYEFIIGITYKFATNPATLTMPPGAYWVLARNPTNLMAIYPNLTTNNTFGPYGGSLANGGERITLAAADYDLIGTGGHAVNEKLNVPVSNLIYGDGGKWGNWSDGQGASLELIDPEADPQFPSNWADSDDSGESQWTSIEFTGPLGETLGSPVNDSVMLMLQGLGECMVDEVEVRADNGPNLVANGGFESGLASWTLQGSHDFSTVENSGFTGGKSLHLRAASRGDNQSNRLLSQPFDSPIPPGASHVSIRVKAKWLRGHPELLVRLHGGGAEAYGRLNLPRRLGSPGMVNSRRVGNAGPAIYNVQHAPVLPPAGQAVIVTALANDPQGISMMKLRYRVDPTATYTDVPMLDNGTGGDAIMNDGIYSATIPGQAGGNMVAFYVEGRDSQNAIGTFPQDVFPQPGFTRCWPNDAVARECVVRWGETQMPGSFATYHLWVTAVNSNRWHIRDTQNNTPMDGTFVYNNSRVVYNALPLYSGSPWHRTNALTGPAGPNRVDYEMNFPDDDPMLGATDFILNNPGNPDILTVSDLSAVGEQTVYKIFEGMGMIHNHRRYVHFFVNGSQRSTAYERPGNFIFEDSQQPNGDMIEEWFPNDPDGQLFKVEDWMEFLPNGFDIEANNDGDLARREIIVDGQPTLALAPYRFMFRKRSVSVGNSANDFAALFALIDAVSPADNPTNAVVDPVAFGAIADWENWMRQFAVQRAVGNFDSYGWDRGKNDYLYKPAAGRFTHMSWDIDYSLGLGRGPTEPLFASNDPRVSAMFNTPAIQRAYWRAFEDLVAGPFNNLNLDPFIDARVAALTAANINIDLAAVAAIKNYIGTRRAFLQSQLATVAATFNVDGPASFSTTNNLLLITGTAPVGVKEISVNGVIYPVTWTSATGFVIRIVLNGGVNGLALQGIDRFGNLVAGASRSVSANYTGPVPNPIGSLVLSEIMFDPAVTGAQFIELVNRSSLAFDLSGWRLDGVNYVFPAGSIITNGQVLVLAENRGTFLAEYGVVPVFGVLGSSLSVEGQILALVKPGVPELVVDAVHYETDLPWPVRVNAGESLQLIDLAQDNSRPSNWALDITAHATPGAPNSVAATLPPYDPLWLNEVQTENLAGPVDNVGERDPWIELYNSGPAALSLAGYYLANNYTTNATQWPFPAATIAPGEFKLIWADGEPGETSGTNLHTSFRLGYSGTLALVRIVGGQPQVTDYLTWDAPGANLSYGDSPNGQAAFRSALGPPTPRGANANRAVPVIINEWMARNTTGIRDPADNKFEDWFELFNAGDTTVDLGGFYFTDNTGIPTRSPVPDNGQYTIPPGGFMLVWADNQPNQNAPGRDLHVGFQLGNSLGTIALYKPDGSTLVDAITYGLQNNDISEGRYSDGATNRSLMSAPTPRRPNRFSGQNTPPSVTPTDQIASPGQTLMFTAGATDPESPPQSITYSLVSAPAGASLTPAGVFNWAVPVSQPFGDYFATLRIADNGSPPRASTAVFRIIVRPTPAIFTMSGAGGQASFSFVTIPGHTYRVLYKDEVTAPSWTQIQRDFIAANSSASLTDFMGARLRRFYQVLQVD